MPHKSVFIHCKLRCVVGHWVSVDEYRLECEWMNMARWIWPDSVVSVMPHKSVFIHCAIFIHWHSSLYPSTAAWRTKLYSSPVPSKVAFERSFLFRCSFPVGATGWQRPTGCLKLHICFRKRATSYRALLRRMIYKDQASYGSWAPYMLLDRVHSTCLR